MSTTIFLLSTNKNNELMIRNIISSNYEIYFGSKSNLMVKSQFINSRYRRL